jgi:transcriptional regulator with XRE-family HTH domain
MIDAYCQLVEAHVRGRLIQARENAGLTKAEAARRMGIHRPTLSEIEGGYQRITVRLLARAAAVYGCTVGGLIGKPEEVFDAPDL